MPAPSYLHYPRGKACVDPAVYPDLEEFFTDVVDVYVQELRRSMPSAAATSDRRGRPAAALRREPACGGPRARRRS